MYLGRGDDKEIIKYKILTTKEFTRDYLKYTKMMLERILICLDNFYYDRLKTLNLETFLKYNNLEFRYNNNEWKIEEGKNEKVFKKK